MFICRAIGQRQREWLFCLYKNEEQAGEYYYHRTNKRAWSWTV